MQTFELTDDVVLLRAPGEADVDRVTTLCQDPAIQEWTTVPSPYVRDDAEGFLTGMVRRGWEDGTQLNWAVRTVGDEVLVGMVGIASRDDGAWELGYWLAPEARGRGLMSRAVALVVDAASARLGITRLTWRAFVGNEPSRRVAERAGFRVAAEPAPAEHRGRPRPEWTGVLDLPTRPGMSVASDMMGR